MQATISVSGRGLIALPAELRKAAGIRPQDSIIAETTPEGILCAEPPRWATPAPGRGTAK
jgi:bifunctional DNA-binding transcriptional regulator/antitoxin component of YhaV-PrlF toxin-antitoxin module